LREGAIACEIEALTQTVLYDTDLSKFSNHLLNKSRR